MAELAIRWNEYRFLADPVNSPVDPIAALHSIGAVLTAVAAVITTSQAFPVTSEHAVPVQNDPTPPNLDDGRKQPGRHGFLTTSCRTAIDAVVDQVLCENLQDFMSLGMFSHLISVSTETRGTQLQRVVLDYLRYVLSEELMVVGNVQHLSLIPWPCSADQAVERIRTLMDAQASTDYQDLSDLCWLKNTPLGDHRAKTLKP